jgi:hypothetical protein
LEDLIQNALDEIKTVCKYIKNGRINMEKLIPEWDLGDIGQICNEHFTQKLKK